MNRNLQCHMQTLEQHVNVQSKNENAFWNAIKLSIRFCLLLRMLGLCVVCWVCIFFVAVVHCFEHIRHISISIPIHSIFGYRITWWFINIHSLSVFITIVFKFRIPNWNVSHQTALIECIIALWMLFCVQSWFFDSNF